MKFKKNGDYGEGPAALIKEMSDPENKVQASWWACIACENQAIVIHKGTGYCRSCYDKRNYNDTLVN